MKMGMRLAVATLAASGLIAAGCGGNDAEESGSGSPDDAVKSFFGAIKDGDGDRACELLTDDSQEALGGDSCSDAITEGGDDFPDDFEVGDVSEDGDTATATVSGDGESFDVPLTKDGDDWKVDFIGLTTSAVESGDISSEDLTTP